MRHTWIRSVSAYLLVVVVVPLSGGAADGLTPRSGVDPTGFKNSVRPQDDFFRYVNGGMDRSYRYPCRPVDVWLGSTALRDKSESDYVRFLRRPLHKGLSPMHSDERKLGDLYASFMDENRAEELGKKPIEPDLARVDELTDKARADAHIGGVRRAGSRRAIRRHSSQMTPRSPKATLST